MIAWYKIKREKTKPNYRSVWACRDSNSPAPSTHFTLVRRYFYFLYFLRAQGFSTGVASKKCDSTLFYMFFHKTPNSSWRQIKMCYVKNSSVELKRLGTPDSSQKSETKKIFLLSTNEKKMKSPFSILEQYYRFD